ncbi:hypothetical protein, partial [Salinivibrio sp. IB643]|uniref:hypothetical protein n=1 Tax=Salinivibrio sp. IB643 TaxID=1909445 RepID=UPI0009C8AA59
HYGRDEKHLKNSLDKITSGYEYDLICVDTSTNFSKPGFYVNAGDVNKRYEFSGYQTGYNYYKSLYDESKDRHFKFFFINDTVFESHIKLLIKRLFKICFDSKHKTNVLRGLKEPRSTYNIIPSCFLCVETDGIPKLDFYPSCTNVSLMESGEVSVDPYIGKLDEFYNQLNNWLYPRSFLKGWYKALPNIGVDEITFRRKSLAIYCEHSLVTLLKGQGVEFLPIDDVLTTLFKFVDRLNTIVIKVRFRVGHLIGREIA